MSDASTDELDAVCIHRPGPINTFCGRCDALVIAGTILGGECGHERLFPPGWTWAPRSWCPGCETVGTFGVRPLAVVPPRARRDGQRTGMRAPSPLVGTIWAADFGTRSTQGPTGAAPRPFSLLDLGLLLGRPTPRSFCEQTGVKHRRYIYRWRDSGLTDELADRLAINACLHPIDVWGRQWEAAA